MSEQMSEKYVSPVMSSSRAISADSFESSASVLQVDRSWLGLLYVTSTCTYEHAGVLPAPRPDSGE